MPRIFLLSPAYCGGKRAKMLLNDHSDMALARQLRAGELTLGAAFTFLSGLYFRGKLLYANAFGQPPASAMGALHPAYVITPTRGLVPPDLIVSADLLREFATVDVSADNPRYRVALERDAAELARHLPRSATVVLLGSLATGKYTDVLGPLLGDRLHYPAEFVGRGDMSRGGLLLRSTRAGQELEYVPLVPEFS